MSSDLPIYYGEREPAPGLRPYVAAYWHFRVEGETSKSIAHVVPPDGSVSLWWPRGAPGLGVLGPRVEPLQVPVRGGDLLWGVRFWPGSARSLLPLNPKELRGRSYPPGAFPLGPWTEVAVARLRSVVTEVQASGVWNTVLLDRLAQAQPLDPAVMTAVFGIIASDGRARIASLAARAGLSPRQLRRRFIAAVGLSAKELARVRRIRASLVDAVQGQDERWVDLAAAYGYSDQAHLVREYRRVVGLAPEALRAYLGRIEHGRVVDR